MSADICVMGGGGHVGLPLSIVFAGKGKKVRIFDINRKTIDTVMSGQMHIIVWHERMLPLLTSLELTSSIQVLGAVLYLIFRAHRNGTDELIGTATFVIHDDFIHMHFYGATPTPTADDRS